MTENIRDSARRRAAQGGTGAIFPSTLRSTSVSARSQGANFVRRLVRCAPLCIVGRDLGKDEVRPGQPLIGAAGRLVRAGIIRAREQGEPSGMNVRTTDPDLEGALKHAILTNTVPFKPIGNKAYPDAIRERFRPFLERLLVNHWTGAEYHHTGHASLRVVHALTARKLNSEPPEAARRDLRRLSLELCVLTTTILPRSKIVMVYPLPHPSPLNRRWFSRFPSMLAARLQRGPRPVGLIFSAS